MAVATAGRKQPRLIGARRALKPVVEARGLARTMLWTGAAITGFFIVLGIFSAQI